MAKTLILVRHGKAAEHLAGTSDKERPLVAEGAARTAANAAMLIKKNLVPDVILCSNAKRSYETAAIFADVFRYSHEEIVMEPDIYEKDADALGRIVVTLPWFGDTALIVGHNPHITWFAREFVHDAIDVLPTNGLVVVRFDTDRWSDLFLAPKETLLVLTTGRASG